MYYPIRRNYDLDNKIKREEMIKEIKTIYSGRLKSADPFTTTPNIASMNPTEKTVVKKHTFFNSVIDKLNIIVENK